jgi:hypothetical protein
MSTASPVELAGLARLSPATLAFMQEQAGLDWTPMSEPDWVSARDHSLNRFTMFPNLTADGRATVESFQSGIGGEAIDPSYFEGGIQGGQYLGMNEATQPTYSLGQRFGKDVSDVVSLPTLLSGRPHRVVNTKTGEVLYEGADPQGVIGALDTLTQGGNRGEWAVQQALGGDWSNVASQEKMENVFLEKFLPAALAMAGGAAAGPAIGAKLGATKLAGAAGVGLGAGAGSFTGNVIAGKPLDEALKAGAITALAAGATKGLLGGGESKAGALAGKAAGAQSGLAPGGLQGFTPFNPASITAADLGLGQLAGIGGAGISGAASGIGDPLITVSGKVIPQAVSGGILPGFGGGLAATAGGAVGYSPSEGALQPEQTVQSGPEGTGIPPAALALPVAAGGAALASGAGGGSQIAETVGEELTSTARRPDAIPSISSGLNVPPMIIPPFSAPPTVKPGMSASDYLRAGLGGLSAIQGIAGLFGAGGGGSGAGLLGNQGGLPQFDPLSRQKRAIDFDPFTYGQRAGEFTFFDNNRLPALAAPAAPVGDGSFFTGGEPQRVPNTTPSSAFIAPAVAAALTGGKAAMFTPFSSINVDWNNPGLRDKLLNPLAEQLFSTINANRQPTFDPNLNIAAAPQPPVPMKRGGKISGIGGGQDDKIPALLSDGEYVMSAQDVSDLGDGSNEEGARRLDEMRKLIRKGAGRKNIKSIAAPQKGVKSLLRAVK